MYWLYKSMWNTILCQYLRWRSNIWKEGKIRTHMGPNFGMLSVFNETLELRFRKYFFFVICLSIRIMGWKPRTALYSGICGISMYSSLAILFFSRHLDSLYILPGLVFYATRIVVAKLTITVGLREGNFESAALPLSFSGLRTESSLSKSFHPNCSTKTYKIMY